jgi:hypothetical protein
LTKSANGAVIILTFEGPLGSGKEAPVEYALFTLMWLAVALLATLGARIALNVFLDLREKLSKR